MVRFLSRPLPSSWPRNIDETEAYWTDVIRNLKPGISEIYCHPALAREELKACARDWQQRQPDFEYFTSEKTRQLIKDEGIQLIGYRALRDAMTVASKRTSSSSFLFSKGKGLGVGSLVSATSHTTARISGLDRSSARRSASSKKPSARSRSATVFMRSASRRLSGWNSMRAPVATPRTSSRSRCTPSATMTRRRRPSRCAPKELPAWCARTSRPASIAAIRNSAWSTRARCFGASVRRRGAIGNSINSGSRFSAAPTRPATPKSS